MFETVVQLSLEDLNRSNKVITYAQANTLPIWGAMVVLFKIESANYSAEQLEDISNAIIIADAIYNSLP